MAMTVLIFQAFLQAALLSNPCQPLVVVLLAIKHVNGIFFMHVNKIDE